MKTAVIAVIALVVLAGCGSATSTGHAHTAPATMSLLQACQVLRADITANGGTADRATLQRIAAHAGRQLPGSVSADAAVAVNYVGKDTWPAAAAYLAHDCKAAGVRIPY